MLALAGVVLLLGGATTDPLAHHRPGVICNTTSLHFYILTQTDVIFLVDFIAATVRTPQLTMEQTDMLVPKTPTEWNEL